MNILVFKPDMDDKPSHVISKILKHRLESQNSVFNVPFLIIHEADLDDYVFEHDVVYITSTDPEYLQRIFNKTRMTKVTFQVFCSEDISEHIPVDVVRRCVFNDVKMLFQPWDINKEQKQPDGARVITHLRRQYIPSDYDIGVLSAAGISLS